MNEYIPDHVVKPCETLQEMIEDKGWDAQRFADELGEGEEYAQLIYRGEISYDSDLVSEQLNSVFPSTKTFWKSLERNYKEALNRGAKVLKD